MGLETENNFGKNSCKYMMLLLDRKIAFIMSHSILKKTFVVDRVPKAIKSLDSNHKSKLLPSFLKCTTVDL